MYYEIKMEYFGFVIEMHNLCMLLNVDYVLI